MGTATMRNIFQKLLSKFKKQPPQPTTISMKDFNISEHVQLPTEVKLAKPSGVADLRFNLQVGIDIVNAKDGTFEISLNNMVFSSNGDSARQYIERVSPETVKQTAALCALVASKQIAATDTAAYTPALTVAGTTEPLEVQPIDPKLLN